MNPPPVRRPSLVVLRVALVSGLLLAAFATVAYAVALLVAWQDGEAGPSAAGAAVGTLCALVALLFVAVFHLRRETVVVPVEDRAAFVRRLAAQLTELGYTVARPGAERLVGRPAFHSLLFGGAIDVRLGAMRAVLTGPKVYLERLRKGMRLHTHLEHVPQSLTALRRRQPGRLLREVRVRLEVPGGLLPEVYKEVAGALEGEGAEIHCELCIHARGGEGLREQVVQARVQDWLRDRHVAAQVHGEPVPARACG